MWANSTKTEKEPLQRLQAHDGYINVMTISQDSSVVATGGEDGVIKMWASNDEYGLESLGSLRGHEGYIRCLTVHDSYVVSGASDNTIRKWNLAKKNYIAMYKGHDSRVSKILCSENFIISTSYDKTIKIWDFEQEGDDIPPVKTLEGHKKGVYSVIFIPAREDHIEDSIDDLGEKRYPIDLLLTGSADNTIKMWNLNTFKEIDTLIGHDDTVTCMQTNGDGTILFSGSFDGTIISWNIQKRVPIKIMDENAGPITCLQLVNRILYSSSQDGPARCWVALHGDCITTYDLTPGVTATNLKFYKGALFAACNDGTIKVFNAKTGKLLHVFESHEAAVSSMVICKDLLCSTAYDGNIVTWDLKPLGMTIHSIYILSKSGGLIYQFDHNVPTVEHEKTFSHPLELTLAVQNRNINVVFGQRDGIKVGHVLVSINGIPVTGTSLEDGREALKVLEDPSNFPISLKFARPKLSTNEKIFQASMFYPLFALACQLSPEPRSSGIEILEAEKFNLQCLQTYTGVKFLVISDPRQPGIESLLQNIYEIYADYALKNPFYSLEMPIRCDLFNENLKLAIEQTEKLGLTS